MGKMGFKTPEKQPPVPPLTQSVNSKTQKGRNSFQQTNFKQKITLRRGELLGIGRPIWLKVQESESRLSLIINEKYDQERINWEGFEFFC